MIGIPAGIFWSHVTEWVVHKHVLHGQGRTGDSFWAFHLREHHRAARANDMVDTIYEQLPPRRWDAAAKELAALALGAAVVLPLTPVAPLFVTTVWVCGVRYYVLHRRAHLDPDWCREHLPWHYDHHMGPNQDSNWGVTQDWVDRLLGTREVYLGTAREPADRARRAARRVA